MRNKFLKAMTRKVFIKAKPNSKVEKVVQIDDAHFEVFVKEPPKEGKANKAIERALAEFLGVKKYQVEIVGGLASKEKVVEIVE